MALLSREEQRELTRIKRDVQDKIKKPEEIEKYKRKLQEKKRRKK